MKLRLYRGSRRSSSVLLVLCAALISQTSFADVGIQQASEAISQAVVTAQSPAGCTAGTGVNIVNGRVTAAPALLNKMEGFAQAANTTGGLNQPYYEVSSLDDIANKHDKPALGTLRYALESARQSGGGWIGFAPQLPHGAVIHLNIPLRLAPNLTIDGGCVAPTIVSENDGSVIYLKNIENVILTRLNITQQVTRDIDPKHGGDCITVDNGADRIWIGFNQIYSCSDGLVDITQSANPHVMRVTVSHNLFRDHDKAMLVKGTPYPAAAPNSAGDVSWNWSKGIQLTLAQNIFFHTGQRHPRVNGVTYAHVVDNIIAFRPYLRRTQKYGASYGSLVTEGGRLLVQNTLYLPANPDPSEQPVLVNATNLITPTNLAPYYSGGARLDNVIALLPNSVSKSLNPDVVMNPPYSIKANPLFKTNLAKATQQIGLQCGTGGWDRF